MTSTISRRLFFARGFAAGAVGLFLSKTQGRADTDGTIPLIVTDHTNETGKNALAAGYRILASGGSALDAVEKAANAIELDPEDTSVGFGGLPNEDGVVQLDASIMDGKTYSAGAVACLENIKTPSSVARCVMERTDHVLLVGKGALEFARAMGFREENLLTEKARKLWLEWKESHSEKDDWGRPEHLPRVEKRTMNLPPAPGETSGYGTTNVLAVDRNGDIAGATSTSGLKYKISGRVGDSPIIGAGLYVDNAVGAAGATGRGEDVIKCCASFYIVQRMKDGRTPRQACEDALRLIIDKYRIVNPAFLPEEKFVALNKKGEFGCAGFRRDAVRMAVHNPDGWKIQEGPTLGVPS